MRGQPREELVEDGTPSPIRDRVTFHRHGNKSVLVEGIPGSKITASPQIALASVGAGIAPTVTCRNNGKTLTDDGEQLSDQSISSFSAVRRPVQHLDSPVGVRLNAVTTAQAKYAVWSESQLEAQVLLCLAQEQAVVGYVTQFARFTWELPLGNIEHFPDIFVELRNGYRVIIDVRPESLWDEAFLTKAWMTARWATKAGIGYAITGAIPAAQVALRLLAHHFKYAAGEIAEAAELIYERRNCPPRIFVATLARDCGLATRVALAGVLQLVARGQMHVDVWTRYDETTEVHFLGETQDTFQHLPLVWADDLVVGR